MNRKRTRLEVVKDILNVIKDKSGRIKPTHVLYKSNLSHQMMEEYLNELIAKGFILEKKMDRSKTYFITDKGSKFLENYKMIANFTESFGLG